MSEENKSLIGVDAPSFMSQEDLNSGCGAEGAAKHIIPSRVKIVQSNAKKPYSELFNEGDVILTPGKHLVCPAGGFFTFTPVYFFTEYCLVNPYKTAGTLPMIRERSLDENSEIAKRCENLESITCPELPSEKCKYKKFLNFLVRIYNSPGGDFPCLLSFSGGEYKYGSNFLGMLLGAQKMYTRNFSAMPNSHENPGNEWIGLDVINPPGDSGFGPWVTDENWYKTSKRFFEQFTEDRHSILADYEDSEEVQPAEADTGEFN